MVPDTYCCIFLNYTLEASTVQVSERALGLTVWITKLARSNNQAFGPFDGVFSLLSLKMARSFPWGRVEDEHLLLELSNVDWSAGPTTTPIVILFTWDSTNFSSSLNKWKKCGGHYLRITDDGGNTSETSLMLVCI